MCTRTPFARQSHTSVFRMALLALVVCCGGAAPFLDETVNSGLPAIQEGEPFALGGNLAAFDADGDGDLDLFLTAGGEPGIAYYRNDSSPGDLHFVEGTEEVGLDVLVEPAMGLAAADFNGDGLQDLFVTIQGGDRLFMAQGDGSFRDESEWRLPGIARFSNGATVADFDLDGDADIHITRYVEKLSWPFHRGDEDGWLVNDGSGVFTDRIDVMGASNTGMALTSVFLDLDSDGDLDLVVANDFGPLAQGSRAFRNEGPDAQGNWEFTDVSASSGLGQRVYGMGIAVLDVNGDGHADLHFTSIGRDVLLAGQGDGTHVDITELAGVQGLFNGSGHHVKWAPVVLDVNGDGQDDLYVRSGHIGSDWFIANSPVQADIPWVFEPTGKASWAGGEGFPDTSEQGRGALAADLDGDGVVDIVAGSANDEELRLLLGSPPVTDVHVRLLPQVSATPAGARIRIGCAAKSRERVQVAGGMFASSAPLDHAWVSFPSECTGGGFVEVVWPSGFRETQEGVGAGQEVVFVEPEWVKVFPASLPLGSSQHFTVQVNPFDSAGEALGPGHQVSVQALPGPWLEALDLGDGTYEVSLPASAEVGETHLNLRVDDALLLPHPVLRVVSPESTRITLHPEHVTETLQTVVHVRTLPGTVAGLYPEGGVVQKVTMLELHHLRAVIVPDVGAEFLELTATQDGAFAGETALHPVADLADDQHSIIEVERPFVSADQANPMLSVRVRLQDANHRFVTADSLVARLEMDGVPLTEEVLSPFMGSVTLVAPLDYSMAGSFAQMIVDEVPFGEPIEIREYATPADLASHVDPERSQVGTSFGTCRADGGDLVAVLFRPHTVEGHLIPADSLAEGVSVVSGIATQDGPFQFQSGRLEGQIRCGEVPGEGEIAFFHEGQPLGVTRDMRARAPGPLGWAVEETAISVAFGGPGLPNTVIIRPRDERGWLVGSGLAVHVAVNGGDGCVPAIYCGIGKYCAKVLLPPGTHALEPIVEGEAAGVFYTTVVPEPLDPMEYPPLVPDESSCGNASPPPEPEPEEDVVEPEEDVVEPEEDVVEPEEDVVEPEEDSAGDGLTGDDVAPDASGEEGGASDDGTVILPLDASSIPDLPRVEDGSSEGETRTSEDVTWDGDGKGSQDAGSQRRVSPQDGAPSSGDAGCHSSSGAAFPWWLGPMAWAWRRRGGCPGAASA